MDMISVDYYVVFLSQVQQGGKLDKTEMKMRCEDAHRIQLALRFGHYLLSTQHFDTVVARVRA